MAVVSLSGVSEFHRLTDPNAGMPKCEIMTTSTCKTFLQQSLRDIKKEHYHKMTEQRHAFERRTSVGSFHAVQELDGDILKLGLKLSEVQRGIMAEPGFTKGAVLSGRCGRHGVMGLVPVEKCECMPHREMKRHYRVRAV